MQRKLILCLRYTPALWDIRAHERSTVDGFTHELNLGGPATADSSVMKARSCSLVCRSYVD